MDIKTLTNSVEKHGLVLRGGFTVSDEDSVPPMANGELARTLVLLGNSGSSLWPQFSKSAEYQDGLDNPLDRWSVRKGKVLADELGASVYFPFGGPPFQPFIRWAKKAENLQSSKIGMLMHPEYGLWHAYRMALAFAELFVLDAEPTTEPPHACDSCKTQPCFSACPVDAFSDNHYDVDRCVHYLNDNVEAECNRYGCIARRSCPEGVPFRYKQSHAQFHMKQFVSARIAVLNKKHD
jgi:hypothetical protein